MRSLPILFLVVLVAPSATGCTSREHSSPMDEAVVESITPVPPTVVAIDQESLVARLSELGGTVERNPLGIPYSADMTQARPAAWELLAQIPTIESLRVGALDSEGLATLVDMKQLAALACTSESEIDDARLVELAKLRELTALEIPGARVTPEGLKVLAGISRLTTLSLAGASIDDEALPVLGTLSYLRRLDLQGTGCTAAGIETLQAALPMCQISR